MVSDTSDGNGFSVSYVIYTVCVQREVPNDWEDIEPGSVMADASDQVTPGSLEASRWMQLPEASSVGLSSSSFSSSSSSSSSDDDGEHVLKRKLALV